MENIQPGQKPFFTVFTPTFNRKHTLPRLIHSLGRAGDVPFEWLVVDDGSNDGTFEWLEHEKQKFAFPVQMFRQQNSGKQSCHNVAIAHARGDLVIILDSDDELAPNALNILKDGWDSIPDASKDHFAAILGNSADQDGNLVGEAFPVSPLDGKHLELVSTGALIGDKLPCYRRDILAENPFPVLENRTVIPEGLVWNRISKNNHTRCINAVVLICHRDFDDPISLMNSYSIPSSNALGKYLYYDETYKLLVAQKSKQWGYAAKNHVFALRNSLHAKIGLRAFRPYKWQSAPLTLICAGLAIGLWLRDKATEAAKSTD